MLQPKFPIFLRDMKKRGVLQKNGLLPQILVALATVAIFVVLVVILRQNVLLRSALEESEKAQAERYQVLEAELGEVSARVEEIAPAMEQEIATTRDRTLSGVNRLENRLAQSLSSVQGRLKDLSGIVNRPVPERVAEAPVSTPAPERAAEAPVTSLAPAPSPRSAADAAQLKVAPQRFAEEDLSLIQAMKDGAERYRASEFAEAAGLFQKVIEKQPDNLDARLYYAASLFRANPGESSNYPKIEQNLMIVLKDRREDSLAMEILGLVSAERGRWLEAVEWLSQVAAREPENASILHETGICAFYASQYRTAQKYLDLACAASELKAAFWFEAGNAYSADDAFNEAAVRFEKCLAVDPRYIAAHLKAGLSYQALGKWDDALIHLNAYLSEQQDFIALDAAGDCLYAKADRAGAETRWKQSLRLLPRGSTDSKERIGGVYVKLVRSAWERADYAQCNALAREGLGHGQQPMLQAFLGMSLAALGETQKGNETLRKLIEESPGTEAAALAKSDLEKRGE
jgi:tetratricopeptide (TPR) repeat protein